MRLASNIIILLIIGLSFSVLTFGIQKAQADVYVIENNSLGVTADDVKEIFLGLKQTTGTSILRPVDNKPIQDEFLQKALGITKARYDAQWIKRSFQEGLNQPTALTSDSEVVSFVKSNKGGIGYVTAEPGAGVKVVKKY